MRDKSVGPHPKPQFEVHFLAAGVSAFTYFPDLEGLALDHESRTEAKLRDIRKFFPHQLKT
jgi:aromatic ring-cleaving dioxygenase